MKPSDGDLIARVLAGDRSGFDDLLERHGNPIWGTLRGNLRNLEDAHEVFQETWLRAFQRLDTLRDAGRLRSWLLSIAYNLVRQRGRRERQGPQSQSLDGADPVEGRPGVEEELASSELVHKLRAEMDLLPDRQREVVDLRVNHELSHAEIAELLGISEEASRANHYQALRRLRARFETERNDE